MCSVHRLGMVSEHFVKSNLKIPPGVEGLLSGHKIHVLLYDPQAEGATLTFS